MKYNYVIAGAGISGCTVAQKLSEAGKKVLVIEKRDRIGGNCDDKKDENGITIQTGGPHIFHTKLKEVYDYLSGFTKFNDYKHKVISSYKGKLYPIPINLTTFNRFYNTDCTSEEMKKKLDEIKENIPKEQINNSRDVVLSKMGTELYEAFIKYYTKKQWDCFPEDLDKEVLERIPIRYDTDDLYFSGQFQGIPEKGFHAMFENMLDSENITLMLNTNYKDAIKEIDHDVLICTAPIDEYFDYSLGKLKYRSLEFIYETHGTESYQENSVVNYSEPDVPYTRITEFKKFYFEENPKTVIIKEIPVWKGDPYYPLPKKDAKEDYAKYLELAEKEENVYFLGRLGKYKYLNMDAACKEALELAEKLLSKNK
ncbi:MAG: UDP-galactopyranose mutase [Candidatus Woesearchaeota archaeon]